MPETDNTPNEKVRQLQRKLWVCAKQSKTRRFHALYDRIYRSDVLWKAWVRVRSNGGAAGVDELTLRSISALPTSLERYVPERKACQSAFPIRVKSTVPVNACLSATRGLRNNKPTF